MAQIIGQVETLKSIRKELNRHGITRFNSIGDINDFLSSFSSEKQIILQSVESNLDSEIEKLNAALPLEMEQCEQAINRVKTELLDTISSQNKRVESLLFKGQPNFFSSPIRWIRLQRALSSKKKLEKSFDLELEQRTRYYQESVDAINNRIQELTRNKEPIISMRSRPLLEDLEQTKRVIEGLKPLIAGAIGETQVVRTLEQLPNDNIIINDFSMSFNPPIYNRNEDDRIYSIQIDHLLINRSGVFVLETKNWSKQSIESLDLRSPVKQIKRSSYALFVVLNKNREGAHFNLKTHHWGTKQIPVRNVVVMINEKPKEKFQHVAIKCLNELTSYVNYFEPIFTEEEVKSISVHLGYMAD